MSILPYFTRIVAHETIGKFLSSILKGCHMPVRILLADKSITIQKVVEMLFSGKEYEVVCVSDGETAISEAERVVPDVVLADVDLPRVDGYSFAARLKKIPTLAQTPVILMMSRDDIYDSDKGKQAGIVDNIAKPFESQELIGKVKKALVAAPPRRAVPEAATPLHRQPAYKAATSPVKPTPEVPDDIFDIIGEAPTSEEVKRAAASAEEAEEESVYEVEPVVEEVEKPLVRIGEAPTAEVVKRTSVPAEEDLEYEVEPVVEEVEDEPLVREVPRALPIGAKAVEEMRAGLGLTEQQEEPQPKVVTFESFETTGETEQKTAPAVQQPMLSESELRTMAEAVMTKIAREAFEKAAPSQLPMLSASEVWSIAEEKIAKMAKDIFAEMPPVQLPPVPESELRSMAEKTIEKMAGDVFKNMPPPQPPKISEDTVRRGIEDAVSKIAREVARDVIEKVVWEVVPQLAEVLIKEEIERLKALE